MIKEVEYDLSPDVACLILLEPLFVKYHLFDEVLKQTISIVENLYAKFVHTDNMPDDSDKKVIDGETEALGLKSRCTLLCCHRYLFRR